MVLFSLLPSHYFEETPTTSSQQHLTMITNSEEGRQPVAVKALSKTTKMAMIKLLQEAWE